AARSIRRLQPYGLEGLPDAEPAPGRPDLVPRLRRTGLTRPLGHLAGRPVTVRNGPASNILRPHGAFSTRLTGDRRYCVINHDGAGNLEHLSLRPENRPCVCLIAAVFSTIPPRLPLRSSRFPPVRPAP